MSFVSYAQNYEDVMLWRALKNIEKGFYIDVGAAWPDEHSVTKAFYDRGWRGINIEPNPSHYASLETKRQGDTNLKVAVGDKACSLTMNFLGETGLSTLIEEIANQHQASGWEISQETVTMQTLRSICNSYIPAGQVIHFLKVDVEGFEAEVLRGNDWIKYRPWIVLVEATTPMTQHEAYDAWEPILKKADYAFAYADGLNRYYVSQEKATDFLKVLQYPPNVFDGYIRIQQHEAEQKAQRAIDNAQATQSQADQLRQQLAQVQSQEQQTKEQLQQALRLAQSAQNQSDQLIQQLALAQTQEQQTKEQLQQALSLALTIQSQAIEQAQQLQQLHQQALSKHNAEALAQLLQVQAQIVAIQKSWSWTATAPLRWGAGILLNPVSSTQAFANQILAWGINVFQVPLAKVMGWVLAKKRVSVTINRWLQHWPHLHSHLVTIARQQNIIEMPIHSKAKSSIWHFAGLVDPTGEQTKTLQNVELNARARQIYLDLKQAIENKKRLP